VATRPLLDVAPDWPGLLAEGVGAPEHAAIQSSERTGRPLGAPRFIAKLEKRYGSDLP